MSIYTKTIIAASILTIAGVISIEFTGAAHGNSSGAVAGRTGSPADGANCTGCHSGTPTTIPGMITSTIPASGYIPGTTYTITASIAVAGINKYGFEISPQTTTGIKKGTMIITSPTEMKLLSTGKYMTHMTGGTSGTGGRTWSFNWTAPAAGSGNFTFYGAFVAANGNGSDTGDQVKLSSLAVTENLSASVLEHTLSADSWSVYPNPATDLIHLSSLDQENELNELLITDLSGKIVRSLSKNELSQNQGIDIADLQSGMYVLNIGTEKGTVYKKFLKN